MSLAKIATKAKLDFPDPTDKIRFIEVREVKEGKGSPNCGSILNYLDGEREATMFEEGRPIGNYPKDTGYLFISLSLVLIAALILIIKSIQYVSDNLDLILHDAWAHWLSTAALVIGSLGLFFLRQRQRLVYSVLEVALGCGIAWVSTDQIGNQPRYGLPGMISASFFLIRGFDNFREGLKQRFVQATGQR